MAFNMKRPIIKGTPLHKASIAKAKTDSIVAQTRTAGDASLVDAGRALGRSYIPKAIDFSKDGLIDFGGVEARENKGKEKGKKKEDMKKMPRAQGEESGPDLKKRVPPETKKKKKKEKRDKSGDKEATKIKSIKPGESKGKKGKGPDLETRDMLYGDTESADSEYVAPYVEEAEDEDVIEDAGQDNEPDMSSVESGNTNSRGYKNWKVREEERNIAAAEANKAKLDAESRARNKVSNIEPKNIEQIPNTTPETKLEQAGPAPEAKTGKGKAHENPDYKAKGPTTNSEGQVTSLGGTPPQNPGYSYNKENDQWTYNDIPVVLDEVPEEFVNGVEVEEQEGYNINLNSNTPSNDSTSVDLLPQPQANTVAPTNTEPTLTPRQVRERKKQDKKYNDPNTGPKVKATMIEEGYNPIKSKNAEKMRDDRIYRNARKDGPVRRNMIKSGYEPE